VVGLRISMKILRTAGFESTALRSLRSATHYWPMHVSKAVHIPRVFIFITADADLLFKKVIDCDRSPEFIHFISFRS
jgi:hypothetical protein